MADQLTRRQRLAKRVGRRGAALLVFGVLYVLSGLPLLAQPAHIPVHIFELRGWALAFVASGVVAWMSAFRQHAKADKLGFVGLLLVGWLWTVYCVFSSILHVLNPVFFPNLWGESIQVAVLMCLVMVCSGWPEPTEPADLAHNLHIALDVGDNE